MKKEYPILDTNIILRFLENDTPSQAEAVKNLLSVPDKLYEIPDVILTEAIFSLEHFYQLSKIEVIEKISSIINFEKFKLNRFLLKDALTIWENNKISFVDAYVAALSKVNEVTFYTFDKKLLKVKGSFPKEH